MLDITYLVNVAMVPLSSEKVKEPSEGRSSRGRGPAPGRVRMASSRAEKLTWRKEIYSFSVSPLYLDDSAAKQIVVLTGLDGGGLL